MIPVVQLDDVAHKSVVRPYVSVGSELPHGLHGSPAVSHHHVGHGACARTRYAHLRESLAQDRY